MSLKGALIGFGQVAEKAHLPGFKERGIEIIAVCEKDPARREAALAALPQAAMYSSYEQLLAAQDGLDFVDIATPPFLHSDQALAALKRGVHVLVEKPLALTPSDLETLRRSASMAGKSVFTVHNWAYAPQWREALALVEKGAIGEPRHMELHALRTQPAVSAVPGDWRREAGMAGGGILIDHGWHNLYLLHRVVKQKPNRVTARLEPVSGAVEEEVTVNIEFPMATATLFLTWKSGIRRNTAFIAGTKGTLEMLDDEIIVRNAGGVERKSFDAPLSAGSAHPTWFAAMLPDFEAEVADPSARGRNVEEASFCMNVIHRAYTGARYGRSPARGAAAPMERTRR